MRASVNNPNKYKIIPKRTRNIDINKKFLLKLKNFRKYKNKGTNTINEKAILKIVKSPKFKSIANSNIGLII